MESCSLHGWADEASRTIVFHQQHRDVGTVSDSDRALEELFVLLVVTRLGLLQAYGKGAFEILQPRNL